jgi:hypothetical protein
MGDVESVVKLAEILAQAAIDYCGKPSAGSKEP